MKIFRDVQGNLYKIEDENALKRSNTISVYDENGDKFELSQDDAKRLKLKNNQPEKSIGGFKDCNNCFRTYPEAAFARALRMPWPEMLNGFNKYNTIYGFVLHISKTIFTYSTIAPRLSFL